MGAWKHSAKVVRVKGICGHEVMVEIPPSQGRPGPVGQRNLARATSRPCYKCREADLPEG